MTESSDAFRQKLFRAAGMPYTTPLHDKETAGTGKFDESYRRNSTTETPPGSPLRKQSVYAQLDGTGRRMSVANQSSAIPAVPNASSRRSAVLADLDAASPFSLGSSATFYSRQKAVKEALVQSIVRRQERNRDNGNSLFLFPSIRNHNIAATPTSDTLDDEDHSLTDQLGESISDFVKLGVQVSSSWLQEELRISPTAKKRFEIFRNPTPEFLDDPSTPKSGSVSESKIMSENGDISEIKLLDIPFSATDILRKQGINVDGSQTMLQKIIWNHDECLLNLQHLSLSSRDMIALSAWLSHLPSSARLFLKLRNCGLTDRSFDLLFEALSQSALFIYALDLSDNKLTSRSTEKILTLLETCKKCQQWELCGLHLQDSFAEALAKSNVQDAAYVLSKLDLSHNTFGNFGICSLVPMVSSFPRLDYLDLSFARITSRAASRISDCLSEFQSLSHLELNSCCLSDEDANTIVCSSYKCKTLTKLCLRDNQIYLMPILSLCAHVCHTERSKRTPLTVIDFSSNPLDFIAHERLMDMKEKHLRDHEPELLNVICNDCNWCHNAFDTLSMDVISVAYGNSRNFNANSKNVQITCDSSKHIWLCFLMVLQWRQCHTILPTCQSDFIFASRLELFEIFPLPKDKQFQIACCEFGFWDLIEHEPANSQASVQVETWILKILKSISLHDFGAPEAVILPVVKNLIFRYDMFTKSENWKQLLAFSGSHEGRLGILLVALAKQISFPGFKDMVLSLPKSISTSVCQKFATVLLHCGNFFSGRSYICFEHYLQRLSFQLIHSFNRSIRIQRINDLSLDLSDDCSVNVVRAVCDETGSNVSFESFVDANGIPSSTKKFVTFDTAIPTCAQGNVSDESETAELLLRLKCWAQSVCSLGIDSISLKAFASCANTVEIYDFVGALELILVARNRNYRCEQVVLMLQVLDQGLLHHIPEYEPTNSCTEVWSRHPLLKALFRIQCGGFRASFLHLMWDSIIDKESFAATVAPCLKTWEWHGATKRLGSLLTFNPLSAEGSWKLHLDKRDDRMVADMIIQLKLKEHGHITSMSPRKDSNSHQHCDKLDDNPFDIRSIGSSDVLPATGALTIHLQSIETKNFDLELRHKLAQKCAVKEWLNTDIWFREMQAKRK